MSQIDKAFLGAAGIALTLGAVQFALGHDLINRWRAVSEPANDGPSAIVTSHVVNRADKADRLANDKPSPVPSRTVSLRLNDLTNTSVVLRVPLTQARTTKPPTLLQNHSIKPTLACEPMVSPLTEVAKLLQPGRCVT